MNINNQHFMKPSGVPTAGRLPTTDSRHPGDFRHPTTDGPEVGGRMSEVEKDSRKSDVGCRMSHPMKPSGVPWLGDIPAGWDVVRIKDAATLVTVRSDDNDHYIGLENVESGTGRFLPASDETFSAESSAVAIQKGDILFGKLRPYLAKCYLAEWDGCCSSEFLVLRTRKQEPRFLKYSLLSPTFIDHVNMSTYGTKMPRANWGIVGGAVAAFPPLPEQRAIADFLDEKCAAIDAIVEEAKAGIEEYAKWKQSVVFEAVTKGIPEGERHPTSDHRLPGDSRLSTSDGPDVESRKSDVEKGSRKSDVGCRKSRPMKDSGVEWIGEIPEEWTSTHVGRIFTDILGKMLANESTNKEDTLESYVCAKDVHFSGIDTSDLKKMWFSPAEKTIYATRNTDLLVVEGGAGAGGAAVVNDGGGYFIQNSIHLVRSKHPCADTEYLRYWIFTAVSQGYIDFVCNKATIPHFTKEKLSSMPLPLPPLPEQRAIAAYLDEKCSAIDALIEEKKQLIEDLGVYKKSLIYETVTGKRLPTADNRLPGDSRLSTSDGPKVGSRMSEVEKDSRRSEVGCRKSKAPEIGNNVTERTLS